MFWPDCSFHVSVKTCVASVGLVFAANSILQAQEPPAAAPKAATQEAASPASDRPRFAIVNGDQPAQKPLFHDVHFHLTNYVHEGIDTRRLLELMENKVGRVALFGIPLTQKWDFFVNGNRRPNYYLESDAEMYYYSFIDAMIAAQYLRLGEKDRQRFDPFIVGFNPTDMNGKDHIRNVLQTFPDVFVGIGEFSIHKELVSSKVTGHSASVNNPALDEILKFAAQTGLLVMLHCDINEMRPVEPHPTHIDDLRRLFARHSGASIIYAHTGLGRFVSPTKNHVALLDEMCRDESLRHVNFDISWDEVAKWIVKDDATVQAWADLLNRYPTRFLFGSDSVAPKDQVGYLKTFNDYEPLWKRLTPETSEAVRLTNYERLVDAARVKVRAWEAENVKQPKPAREPEKKAADAKPAKAGETVAKAGQ